MGAALWDTSPSRQVFLCNSMLQYYDVNVMTDGVSYTLGHQTACTYDSVSVNGPWGPFNTGVWTRPIDLKAYDGSMLSPGNAISHGEGDELGFGGGIGSLAACRWGLWHEGPHNMTKAVLVTTNGGSPYWTNGSWLCGTQNFMWGDGHVSSETYWDTRCGNTNSDFKKYYCDKYIATWTWPADDRDWKSCTPPSGW